MILKMTHEKSNAFKRPLKKLNSFLDDVENAKNDANILKTYFFWIFVVFSLFLDFPKIYQKGGSKIG
jgi:hypothetical protein